MNKVTGPIHNIISIAIAACGKPHSTIAAELGYSNDAIIARFASGEINVPLHMLPALADAIGLDRCELFVIGLRQYNAKLAEAIFESVQASPKLFIGENDSEMT